MTHEEIKKIPELQINVTPAIEDAFYFLQGVEKREDDITEAQANAGKRLEKYSREERMEAVQCAYKMLDNIDKYGIPCAAWT
jgi:hypothetical protein